MCQSGDVHIATLAHGMIYRITDGYEMQMVANSPFKFLYYVVYIWWDSILDVPVSDGQIQIAIRFKSRLNHNDSI